MAEERLLTSWSEYEAAVAVLLPAAQHTIAIFDHDLLALKLEKSLLHDALAGFLKQRPAATLRIAVQSAQPMLTHSPRLLALLRWSAHSFHLVETPPHLARLNDSMLLVDGASAVIRFHREQPRGKQILADAEACKPYCQRFEEIWSEGGTPISATALGL